MDISPMNFENDAGDSEEALRELLEFHGIEKECQVNQNIIRKCG